MGCVAGEVLLDGAQPGDVPQASAEFSFPLPELVSGPGSKCELAGRVRIQCGVVSGRVHFYTSGMRTISRILTSSLLTKLSWGSNTPVPYFLRESMW